MEKIRSGGTGKRRLQRIIQNIRSTRLLVKILMVLACVLFLFYGYVVYLNLNSWKRADQELMNTVYDKLYYYISDLESNLVRINLLEEQFSNELDITLLSLYEEKVFSEYRKMELEQEVQKRLSQFYVTNSLVNNARIHFRNLERTIDCFRAVRDLNWEEYRYYTDTYRGTGKELQYYNGRLVMVQLYPSVSVSGQEPLYIASCEINTDQIARQMELLSEDSVSNMVLAANDDSWHVGNEGLYNRFLRGKTGVLGERVYSREEGRYYYVISTKSDVLDAAIYSFLPEGMIRQNKLPDNLVFLVFSVIAVLMIFLIYYVLNQILVKPMNRLMDAFDMVKHGKMDYQIEHSREDEFAYLYNNFNEMIHNINTLTTEVTKQEKLVMEAELKQLQYQINPHFLYNSLYLIYRLAKRGENEMVEELSQYLGGYYRYITKSSTSLVPVRDEIEHCRKYINIQKMRFADRIEVVFEDLDHRFDGVMIPILSFQPIIENAFEHGIKNEENGKIRIYFQTEGERIRFIVEDNGPGMTQEQIRKLYREFEEEGSQPASGIVNVYKRLRGILGGKSDIRIETSCYGGTKVCVTLF